MGDCFHAPRFGDALSWDEMLNEGAASAVFLDILENSCLSQEKSVTLSRKQQYTVFAPLGSIVARLGWSSGATLLRRSCRCNARVLFNFHRSRLRD